MIVSSIHVSLARRVRWNVLTSNWLKREVGYRCRYLSTSPDDFGTRLGLKAVRDRDTNSLYTHAGLLYGKIGDGVEASRNHEVIALQDRIFPKARKKLLRNNGSDTSTDETARSYDQMRVKVFRR